MNTVPYLNTPARPYQDLDSIWKDLLLALQDKVREFYKGTTRDSFTFKQEGDTTNIHVTLLDRQADGFTKARVFVLTKEEFAFILASVR